MNSDEVSEVQAKSLESEDGMVDISMADGEKAASSSDPKDPPVMDSLRKPVAPMLRPGSFITPAVRNLFELRVLATQKSMIPTGINYISEERKEYPLLSSRQSDLSAQPKMRLNQRIEQRQSLAGGSPLTSDEDADDVLPSAEGQSHNQESASESDDGLPPVEQIVQPRIVQPRGGFGTFNQSTPRNRKGLITYGRKVKGKSAVNKAKLSRETTASRETTPTEGGSLLHLGESLILDWQPGSYDALFVEGKEGDDPMRGVATWHDPPDLPDAQLAEKRRIRLNRRRNGITLGDCLDEFGKPEILSENDAWYCPRCKEHRRASKTFELWKAPDILVIHLKRFSAQGRFRDKLDVFVDFPTEGLDLSTRLAVPDEDKSPIYDLFAVDNHYGGLGGGHYTACAQNFVDNVWYEYNGKSSF